MTQEGTPITRDEALLWLNDRLGTIVGIVVEKGDLGIAVMELRGRLRHWRELHDSGDDEPRDDVAGLYAVGDSRIDLTDLDHVRIWSYDYGGVVHRLRVQLGDDERGGVFLNIIGQDAG